MLNLWGGASMTASMSVNFTLHWSLCPFNKNGARENWWPLKRERSGVPVCHPEHEKPVFGVRKGKLMEAEIDYFWLPLLPGPHSFLIVRTAALCLAFESIQSSDLDARHSSSAVADLMKELPSGLFFTSGMGPPATTTPPSTPSSASLFLLLLGHLFPIAVNPRLESFLFFVCLCRSLSELSCVVSNVVRSSGTVAPLLLLSLACEPFCFWDPLWGGSMSPVMLSRKKFAHPSAPTSDFHKALWIQFAFFLGVSSLISDFKFNPSLPSATGWVYQEQLHQFC